MQAAEITQRETAERARLLRVDSYDVSLDLTKGDEVFGSTSVITFGCAEPGANSYVDLIARTVHSITLNGTAIDPALAWADGRIALTGLAARNELRVVADCIYGVDVSGLSRSVDSADGRIYTFTQFEPADARRMFANFEQPDLKATFAFHVTALSHWVVLSNQPAPEPEPAGDGTAVWHFEPTPRISTYLTAIVAGEYYLIRQEHTTPSGQSIPLALGCRQSLASYLEPEDVLGITKNGLDYFTQLFGCDYPFAKYDQVYVADHVGAMENVGCVTITEVLLFRSKVTDAMYEARAMVILHEMAHQWFGDLVTMTWWNDLWLNESFAELAAFLATAEATRFTDAWTSFCVRKVGGYRADQLPSTHPIAADSTTLSEAIGNADEITYTKGASVLKQLVAYLGRDGFFAGLQAYFAQHGWGNATLSDLLTAVADSSGQDLGEWSKAWLETAGPNTLRAEFEVEDDGTFMSFAVVQEAPAEHQTLRPHHIAIGLYNHVDGALVRTHRVETDLAGARTEVADLTGQPRPDVILLNDDDLSFALVRFDDRSLRTLMTSMGAFADGLARTIGWVAVLDMVGQAEISVPAFVSIVTAGMGAESSISVLQLLHIMTQRVMATTADPAWVATGKEQLASRGLELLRAAEPGSGFQLAWAQLLGSSATSDEQLDVLTGLLAGTLEIAGLTVDAELRWLLLARLATMSRAGDVEIDAELERDDTDAGRRHAMACRAAMPDAEHKAAAWRELAESAELSFETATEVARSFGQPEHAQLLAPYTEKYFQQLPAIWAARSELVRMFSAGALFPYSAASPELLDRVEAFAAEPGRDPAMARVVIEAADTVQKALRSRALPS